MTPAASCWVTGNGVTDPCARRRNTRGRARSRLGEASKHTARHIKEQPAAATETMRFPHARSAARRQCRKRASPPCGVTRKRRCRTGVTGECLEHSSWPLNRSTRQFLTTSPQVSQLRLPIPAPFDAAWRFQAMSRNRGKCAMHAPPRSVSLMSALGAPVQARLFSSAQSANHHEHCTLLQ